MGYEVTSTSSHAGVAQFNDTFIKRANFVEVPLSGPYVLILFLYIGVCASGLLGNGSVIFIILNFRKMKTVTNFYILNLAMADVMFLTGIPFLIATIALQRWPFGDGMCKAYWITANVNQFVSSMFCLVLSGDRFVAVYLALSVGRKYRRPRIARYVCLGVWIFAILIMIPVMRYARTVIVSRNPVTGVNVYSCQIVWPDFKPAINRTTTLNGMGKNGKHMFDPNKAFTLYTFAFGYGIPVLLTSFFYFMVVFRLKSTAIPNYNSMAPRSMVERSTLPSVSSQHSPDISSKANLIVHDPLQVKVGNNGKAHSTDDRLSQQNGMVEPCVDAEIHPLKLTSIKRVSTNLIPRSKTFLTIPKISLSTPSTSSPGNYLTVPNLSPKAVNSGRENSHVKRRKRGVRRVTSMVLIVIAVYVCSWTPYWVLQLILSFRKSVIPPKTIYASVFIYCLAYANSSMNPILYAFLSNSFKNCFTKLFVCRCFTPWHNPIPSLLPKPNWLGKPTMSSRTNLNDKNRTHLNIPIIIEGETINPGGRDEAETRFQVMN